MPIIHLPERFCNCNIKYNFLPCKIRILLSKIILVNCPGYHNCTKRPSTSVFKRCLLKSSFFYNISCSCSCFYNVALLVTFVYKKGGKINEALFLVVKTCFLFQHVKRLKGCATKRHGFSDNCESQSKSWMLQYFQ